VTGVDSRGGSTRGGGVGSREVRKAGSKWPGRKRREVGRGLKQMARVERGRAKIDEGGGKEEIRVKEEYRGRVMGTGEGVRGERGSGERGRRS